MKQKLLNTKEAAKYIGFSHNTLRCYRSTGKLIGQTPMPPYIKHGRSIRYLKEELDIWISHFASSNEEVSHD